MLEWWVHRRNMRTLLGVGSLCICVISVEKKKETWGTTLSLNWGVLPSERWWGVFWLLVSDMYKIEGLCFKRGLNLLYIRILNGGRAHRRRNEGAPDYYCPLLPITSPPSTLVHLHWVVLYRIIAPLVQLHCIAIKPLLKHTNACLILLVVSLLFMDALQFES